MSTVINNTRVINEDVLRLHGLIQYFPDPNTANPLANAKLYFGIEDRDPTTTANQKLIYAIKEDKTVVPIPQPVRTSAGGVPVYNNSPVTLAIVGSFSFKCLNEQDIQQYYFPFVSGLDTFDFSGQITEEKVVHSGSSVFTFEFIECTTASFYKSITDNAFFEGVLLENNVDYRIVSPTQIELLNTVSATTQIIGRQMDIIGTGDNNQAKGASVYSQPTISDAKAIPFDVGDNVLVSGKDQINDGLGGKYICVEASTGAADDENFINLSNGNQLQLIGSNRKLEKYIDKEASAVLENSSLTLDLNNGTSQKITLTQNVTNLIILNQNSRGQTSFTLEVNQGETLNNITWPSNISWAGGTAPTVTQIANKRDRFGFISTSSGWDAVVIGQNYD